MTFASGYRGSASGSVQAAYTDQPAAAVPGMLAYASDNVLLDTYLISEADGIGAGKGIVLVAGDTAATTLQRPNKTAELPDGTATAADFAGILAFDEAMQSDENGNPGWAVNRAGRFMRPHRAGGRMYVLAKEAVETTDTVNWVITAPVDASFEVGDFSPAALGGGDAGVSVELPNARWETGGAEGELVIIELLGDYVASGS